MIVAVDGPAGSGKGKVTKKIKENKSKRKRYCFFCR